MDVIKQDMTCMQSCENISFMCNKFKNKMGKMSLTDYLSGLRDEECSGIQVRRYFGEHVQEQRKDREVDLKRFHVVNHPIGCVIHVI